MSDECQDVVVVSGELLDIAIMMAQDLQEYVTAGEEAGSEMGSTKSLLEEWDKAYQKILIIR